MPAAAVIAPAHGAHRRTLLGAAGKTEGLSFSGGDGAGASAALHLLHAGITCAAVLGLKLYRSRPRRPVPPALAGPGAHSAESQLAAAQAELASKEEQLRALQEEVTTRRFSQEQGEEVAELRSRLRAAQGELLAAGQRCTEATERMARTACDLAVTEAELRAQRLQLQDMKSRLETTEGELGLTRSQNLTMQREMAGLRRQLREAGGQLEGHMAQRAARSHACWEGGHVDEPEVLEAGWD
ncbi:hypothetical protein TSOC_009109 [Tetrabaena socialis]|uniref:Uncharacterized protein n=1 Tax=Tetrabaena socialis TaxID=47790 RepID=A0A2J7ZWX8_9CHLO|nr:hypothetical protein TSOC_009109 [Tetrabaena socialis]|eukprot:PNH04769.1 hypothetical protein TSOC_009109 [Tetrabaena socialis]